jgi:hypothetical protein
MAMPQTVEKCKHYPDPDAFHADQVEMRRRGWTDSDVRLRTIRNGPLVRVLLRRPTHTEVDVRYTRGVWSVGHDR